MNTNVEPRKTLADLVSQYSFFMSWKTLF
jgi:hypothetical protein